MDKDHEHQFVETEDGACHPCLICGLKPGDAIQIQKEQSRPPSSTGALEAISEKRFKGLLMTFFPVISCSQCGGFDKKFRASTIDQCSEEFFEKFGTVQAGSALEALDGEVHLYEKIYKEQNPDTWIKVKWPERAHPNHPLADGWNRCLAECQQAHADAVGTSPQRAEQQEVSREDLDEELFHIFEDLIDEHFKYFQKEGLVEGVYNMTSIKKFTDALIAKYRVVKR